MIEILRPGEGAAFVCVHPVDGQINHYAPLAAALQWPGPIVGVSAEPGITSFAALAAKHADELLHYAPTVLLGWAMGGVLAAEIASDLVERGCTITRLVALDSRVPVPEMRTRPTDYATIAKFFVFQRAQMFERTAIQPASYEPPAIFEALQAAGTLGDIPDPDALARRIAIVVELTRAFFHHEMHPIPLTVDLFESTESLPSHPKPPTLGWEAVAPRVVHHVAAGNHFSLLAPSRCAALSAALNTL